MTKSAAAHHKRRPYRRVLLKISGEALQGERRYNIDPDVVARIAREIAEAHALKVQIAITVGGGNIFRGASAAARGMDRVLADSMGMLATVINALALRGALEKEGVPVRVLTAIEMRSLAEPFIQGRAVRHLEKGRVVVFAAGTGNPYFSTDTAAALRASEIGAEAMLKATKVDGVYDRDPSKHSGAKRYQRVSYQEAITKNLGVMDQTALAMCRENRLPVVVFDLNRHGNIRRVLRREAVGTIIEEE